MTARGVAHIALGQLVRGLTIFAEASEKRYEEAKGGAVLNAEQLGIILCAIRDARTDLATLAARVERDLLLEAGERHFVVEGLGEFTVKRRTKRTAWQHEQMVAAVVSRVMDEPATITDPESGERLPYATIGHNVAARLRECVSFGAGKVTGLRAIGLQPDEFCSEQPDGYSVALPARVTP